MGKPCRCLTVSPSAITVTTGETVALRVKGGTGAYTWEAPNGTPATGTGRDFQTIYYSPGAYQVTAHDARATLKSGWAAVTVLQGTPAPIIDSTPPGIPDGIEGVAYSQLLVGAGGTAPYTFAVVNGALPTGLSLSSVGLLSGTPTQSGAFFAFTVLVLDANGDSGRRDYTFAIASAPQPCGTISVVPTAIPNGVVGSVYVGSFAAFGGASPYTYAVTAGSLPTGLSLSAAGGLSGTPTTAGVSTCTVTATDVQTCTGDLVVTLTIAPAPCPPITVTPSALANGQDGVAYSQTIGGSGGTAPYVITKASGTLPTGLSLASTGALTGTASAAGTFTFTALATDANGCIGTVAYTVVIVAAPCPTITVSPTSLPDGTVGIAYSQTISGSGGASPYVITKQSGSLPTGLSLASNGALTGTPTTAQSVAFTALVTDTNSCTGTKVYSVTIRPAPCPTISLSPSLLPSGTVGVAYSQTLTPGAGTSPYTYAVTSGTLPLGMTLSPSGATALLSGTPIVQGFTNLVITVTDANGCSTGTSYTLLISPASSSAIGSATFTGIGWTTFGLALPAGSATNGVQVGGLTTQTDIKTRWADNSIRFCIVSVNILATGTYAITASTTPGGTLTPTWPTVTATFVIGGTTWTASLPSFTGADSWLSGPLVRDARALVVPTAGGVSHPILQVVFDVRSYLGGGHRVDWTVQTSRNSTALDKFDATTFTIVINGTTRVSQAVTFYAFSRVSYLPLYEGATEAIGTVDLTSAIASGALPRVTTGLNTTQDTSTAAWGINLFGTMDPNMTAGGYRRELGPLTEWQARFVLYQNPTIRRAMLIQGRASGSWPCHLGQADGVTLWHVTDPVYTNARFDPTLGPGATSGCLAPARPDGFYRGTRDNVAGGYSDVYAKPNNEHLLHLTVIPYLITGDRYYLDQSMWWANYGVMSCYTATNYPEPVYVPTFNRARQGIKGLLWPAGLTRELGHPLFILVDTAAIVPDAHADHGYFHTLVQNQLDALADYVSNKALAGGAMEALGWEDFGGGNQLNADTGQKSLRYTSWWRLAYTAWGIHRASVLGLWSLGTAAEFRNRVVRGLVRIIQNPGPHNIPSTYYPQVADDANGAGLTFYGTPGGSIDPMWAANYTNAARYATAKTVTLTRSGSTATGTCTTDHHFQSNGYLTITGATQPEYNVSNVIMQSTGARTFTFQVPGAPVSPATGTITAHPLGWPSIGINPPQQYNGVEVYLGLSTGIRAGVAGAQAARDSLMSTAAMQGDLGVRCGYALE